MDECSVGSLEPSPDCGNQRLGPGPGLDLSEVKNDVLKIVIFVQVDKYLDKYLEIIV